jgi:prepilin-type N-terminal cleavage/methylation domain-containing protein
MKKAFTLVEILIVVAILGILAAIALPTFSGHIQEAKESAAKDNLRILRNAIDLYASQHNGVPPGYPLGRTSVNPVFTIFILQLTISTNKDGHTAAIGTDGYPLGPYLSAMPKNPFTNRNIGIPKMITNGQDMPAEATGAYDWIYKAATKDIRLDWPGTDSKGVPYYSY